MASMTFGTISDGVVVIGFSDTVTWKTSGFDCAQTFKERKGICRTVNGAFMIRFGIVYLFFGEILTSANSSPCRRRVPASQKLVALSLMALGTVLGSYACCDDESTMVDFFLPLKRYVAIKTVYPCACMTAFLILMNDCRGLLPVA